jgi:spermidine synthase
VLDGLQADAPAIFGLPTDAAASAWQQRLAAYWAARHQHLRNGMAVQPAANLQAMLAQVRAPLLATLRTSPDFRPAYDPLLRMALALQRDDPAAARRLLTDLQAAAPQRSEAADALARLP